MIRHSVFALLLFCAPALAEVGDKLIDDGDNNPEEQTLKYFAEKNVFTREKSTACTYGYWAAKSGHFKEAKQIFDKCVAIGVEGAYPWQAYMSQSGLGTRKSLEDAAEWDRKSALLGYKVGQFNYGLDLLRGHGVAQDIEAGKALVDQSAAQGFEAAQALKDSGYDPEVAIPDADEVKIY
jgi:TPR repeat protein